MVERPALRTLIERTCMVCVVVGRACGGDPVTCAVIGCSACHGVTWLYEHEYEPADTDETDEGDEHENPTNQ